MAKPMISSLLAQGVFATYGYFIIDANTKHGFLIDPGAQKDLFLRAIRENGLVIEKILLTHGHFDHFGAAAALRNALDAPVYAHSESEAYLSDPFLNLSGQNGAPMTLSGVYKFHDGDICALQANPDIALKIVHTPGHTDDSCVFINEAAGAALVGDTIYQGEPGLTIFPTGDARMLRESIAKSILTLPADTLLCSGHAQPISVREFAANLS